MMEECSVYIMETDHVDFGKVCKIGMSNNPCYRRYQIAACNPNPVELVFWFPFKTREIAQRVEREFHRLFEPAGIGCEWFMMGKDRALFMLAMVTVRALSEIYPKEAISTARRDAKLLDAFAILDTLDDDFHLRCNAMWDEVEPA